MNFITRLQKITDDNQKFKSSQEEDKKKLDWDIDNLAEKYDIDRKTFINTILKNKIESILDDLEDDPYNLPAL